MQAGITPGKKMGLLLKEAMRIAVDKDLEDAPAILERLKKTSVWTNEA